MAPGPAPKRARIETFKPGSVLRIEVENFMTYARAAIEPGPKLNLVLGPNGTGKSSLVCALCVGLAGATRILGRAEDVSQFVRRGEASGEVTVTLAGAAPGQRHAVRRRITARGNASEWWLDGAPALQREVLALTARLGIQLDNLCQFLPQDKVVEFARLRPVELLRATERAVGGEGAASLAARHERLVELRSELAEVESGASAIDAAAARLREENARAERSVAAIQRRDELAARAGGLRAKVPWAEAEAAAAAAAAEEGRLAETRARLRREEAASAAAAAPLRAKRAARDAAENAAREAAATLARANPTARAPPPVAGRGRAGAAAAPRSLDERLSEAIDALAAARDELDGLEDKAERRERTIRQLEAAIARKESELAAAAAEVAARAAEDAGARERLSRELKDAAQRELALSGAREEAEAEREGARGADARARAALAALADARRQRLAHLDQKHRGVAAAWAWLQAHSARFAGPVLGPVALEVEPRDAVAAAQLEQHLPANAWLYFVVESAADQALLQAEMRAATGYRPYVIHYGGNPAAPLAHPAGRAADYARFGAVCTLDEAFQAPQIVKHVMNDMAFIASALVCGSADADWEGLFAANGKAQMIWTPAAQMQRRVSAYNRAAVSTMVNPLRPAALLAAPGGAGARGARGGGADVGDGAARAVLEREAGEAAARLAAADARLAALGPDLVAAREATAALRRKGGTLGAAARDAAVRKQRVGASLRADTAQLARARAAPDPRARRAAAEAEAAAARRAAAAAGCALARGHAARAAAAARHSAADLALRELADQAERLARADAARGARHEELRALVTTFQAGVRGLKAAAATAREKAQAATGWPIPPELEAAFASMPAAAADLARAAQAAEDEAEGLAIADPSALGRYRARCDELARCEEAAAALEARRGALAAEAAPLRASWLAELRAVVAAVNDRFSADFPAVGVAGEVALFEAPGDDFARFAIEVRVKFREGESLATLDANRQSGGERSVSTMLFLVALQRAAAAPLRVVDEINQGMDPRNERCFFGLLAAAAVGADAPQCFLLTPKLLPGLPFSDVTVLQIFNGAHIAGVASGFRQDWHFGAARAQRAVAAV